MKRFLFMLMIMLFIGCYISSAQHPTLVRKHVPLRATIKSENQLRYGFLKSINDTSLQLSQKRISFTNNEALTVTGKVYHYHYIDIEQMKVWRDGKLRRSIGIGGLAGMGIGAIIGLITYQKPDPDAFFSLDFGPGFSALVGAFIGALPGAIIGGIAGTKKPRFNINKNKSHFNDMRAVIFEKHLRISKPGYEKIDSTRNGS